MVRSMSEMARLLNKPVVAEFVETEGRGRATARAGHRWAQGFHYHVPEPLTAEALRACLPPPAPATLPAAAVPPAALA